MSWVNTSPLVKTYTLDEFWRLPDHPDRSKLELIAGVLYMTPPPEYTHDNVVTHVIRLITTHLIASRDPGKLYVPRAAIWTGPHTYLEPDLFYLSAETESRLGPEHRDTADLVVEVISPGSAIYDRNAKADTYGALEVKELWLIDIASQTVEVRYRGDGGFSKIRIFSGSEGVESSVLPGLTFTADELFID